MRKSRLSLFKSTSMMISVVGIIMIISTIIVVAYVGYSMVSSSITNEISSGTQYDELAELKAGCLHICYYFHLMAVIVVEFVLKTVFFGDKQPEVDIVPYGGNGNIEFFRKISDFHFTIPVNTLSTREIL